jgi:hypothetical protein
MTIRVANLALPLALYTSSFLILDTTYSSSNAATTALGVNVSIALSISSDGTVSSGPIGPPLMTSAGTWTWGTPTGDGQYSINLNGVSKGQGVLIEVANGGKLYANTIAKGWWIWNGFAFTGSSPPPGVPDPTPTPTPSPTPLSATIAVTPSTPSIPDTTTKGSPVANFTVSMNDSTPFNGTVTFGPPNFDNNGVFSLSPLVRNPNGSVSGQILVNPNGPGIGPNVKTVTDHITLVGTQ